MIHVALTILMSLGIREEFIAEQYIWDHTDLKDCLVLNDFEYYQCMDYEYEDLEIDPIPWNTSLEVGT